MSALLPTLAAATVLGTITLPQITQKALFHDGDAGIADYRIPALLSVEADADGKHTLLAFASPL